MLFGIERTIPMQPSLANPTLSPNPLPAPSPRDTANRANSQHSTGPRTESGKQRSSLNALRHGLSSRTAVMPSEDPQAYQLHCQQFHDEYQPKTPTEIHLVQELADTAWRLERIPLLEANLLARSTDTRSTREPIADDVAEATRALATLGMHGQRLSRQFHKTLDQLRAIQTERREREQHDLKRAASLLELHKHKGIPYDPAQDGFFRKFDGHTGVNGWLKGLAVGKQYAGWQRRVSPIAERDAGSYAACAVPRVAEAYGPQKADEFARPDRSASA